MFSKHLCLWTSANSSEYKKSPFFFFFFWSLPRQKILGHTVLRLSECDAANDIDTSQRKHCLHCWDWWPVMTGHQLKCRAGTIVALTFQAFAGQIASTILLIFAVQQRIFGIYFYPSLDLGPHRIAWPVNLKKTRTTFEYFLLCGDPETASTNAEKPLLAPETVDWNFQLQSR